MITAERCDSGLLKLTDSQGKIVAWTEIPCDLKEGERLPVKSLKIDGDNIVLELERPMSLVEAVEDYFGFTENYDATGCVPTFKELYEAWLREKGKSR